MSPFEEFAAAFDGIVAEEYAQGQLNGWRRGSQSLVDGNRREGRPIDLEVGYVGKQEFNAWALTHRNTDVIAISMVVPATLTILMAYLLDHPEVAPDIGDVQHCQRSRSPVAFTDPAFLHGDQPLPAITDPERAVFAKSMANLAEGFIIEHELAHIMMGHTDWFGERHGLSLISELGMAGTPGLSGFDLQTIEYDADITALNRVLTRMLGAKPGGPDGKWSKWDLSDSAELLGPPELAVERIAFALYVCHRVLGGSLPHSIEEALLMDHPAGPIRTGMNMLAISVMLQERVGLDREKTLQSTARAIGQAERGMAAVFGGTPLNVFSDDAWEMGSKLEQMLRTRYRELKPELEPHYRRQG